jgi:hypothetical protein
MRSGRARRERGAALLALLAVIMLGASWFLVSNLSAESGGMAAINRARNAAVLNRAKQALIGYVAAQAAKAGENNPGALPCPENPGDFDSITGRQGLVGTGCGTTTVGRFPWRTLGLDQLVDASGEPLWYVVSTGWGAASTSANTLINSNSVGQLTVDGVSNDAVALIIAPGPAFNVPACATSTAKNQVRPKTGTPDWRNYLECENATYPTPDATFVTTGPSGSFNDQVVRITAAEILPAIEAAIAHRIEREVAPQLRSAYAGGSWSATTVLPFAAAFADPSTSTMKGASGTFQGLLPLNYSETSPKSGTACTPGGSAPRCNPTFVAWTNFPPPSLAWTGGATLHSSTCSIAGTSVTCTIVTSSLIAQPNNTVQFKMVAIANNVGMALRQLNPLAAMVGVSAAPVPALSGVLNDDSGPVAAGSATITVEGSAIVGSGGLLDDLICGLSGGAGLVRDCHSHELSFPITLLADHPILDSTDATYGWFMRNKWHEVAYYSVATGVAPSGARSCATNSNCLTVTNHRTNAGVDDAGAQRGVIILSGRTLTGASRPNGILSDWLEGANAGGVSPFELRSPSLLKNRTFNDRIAVLDSN